MAHGLFCKCKKCNPSFMDMLFGSSGGSDPFKKSYTDRNGKPRTIYGDKTFETKGKPTPGYRHGDDWGNGGRTPHQSIGHQAVKHTTGHDNNHHYGTR